MDGDSVGTCQIKPVPLPRKSNKNIENRSTKSLSPTPSTTTGPTPSDINSNIDNLLAPKPIMSKFNTRTTSSPLPPNKPVPLPRKFVRSNGTTAASASPSPNNMPDLTNVSSAPQSFAGSVKSEDYEDDVDDDIDFASIPSRPNLPQQSQESEEKRATINLFKRDIGDPFKDFDSFNSYLRPNPNRMLEEIKFRSPLEDLDEAARSRISIASLSSSTTTSSKSSSEYSDFYMEPPPARPVLAESHGGGGKLKNSHSHGAGGASTPHSAFSSNTVPSKPKRSPNIVLPRLSSLEENEVLSASSNASPHKPATERKTSLPPSAESYEPLTSYTTSPGLSKFYVDNGKKFHTISSASTKNTTRRGSGEPSVGVNNLSNNTADFSLPINSNFTNSKRATVPILERVPTGNVQSTLNNHHASFNAATDHHHPHHRNAESKNPTHKFDATAYDVSYVLQDMNGKSYHDFDDGFIKRRSLGTPPTGSQEFSKSDAGSERSAHSASSILRRHSSNRSTCSSASSNSTGGRSRDSYKQKKAHEYDEVAIEDGNVVFLGQPNSLSDSSTTINNNSSSSITSRYSMVQEFDPLFDTRTKSPSAGFPETTAPLDLNDTQQHRYEYIDTDAEDGHSCASSTTSNEKSPAPPGIVALCIDNPSYSPSTPRSSREIKVLDEMYEPVLSSPKEGISPKLSPKPRMGIRVLRSKTDEFSKHGILPSTPSPPMIVEERESNEKADVSMPDPPTATTLPSSTLVAAPTTSPPTALAPQPQSNFFRKFSSKFRLNSIKEEKDDKKVESLLSQEETYYSVTTPCNKCSEPHPESTKCRFVPTCRFNIVYSSHLFRTTGLSKKEFSKKWGVLARSKLTFYNDKSEVISEIALDKFSVVSKRNDYKVAQSQSELKCFELGLSGGKPSSYVFASASEDERAVWMHKMMEVYTSGFPTGVLKNYDRGGWGFIKETVTSDWRACWLILKDRSLYYSFWKSEDSFEMDLRKARSIALSQKEDEYKCPYTDNADVLTVDFICKLLYIQTETSKVTASWEKAIKSASSVNGTTFDEMQLTLDNVPVIVDKCIDFLYAHGTLAEGIYRQSGSNSRITNLLQEFKNDAWSVQISQKEYNAHDVAGTLKRFFRTLPEPLFTSLLYDKWIKAAGIGTEDGKRVEYMRLLDLLPQINYNILKKLMCHLLAVHHLQSQNLMPLLNLAPIWGPTLMNVDTSNIKQSYEIAILECDVVKDLIQDYHYLFRVDEEEIAREKKMQDALENFHLGSLKRKCSGDMKIWIYIWEKDEASSINITLTPNSTTYQIVQQICSMSKIKYNDNLTLYEIICNGGLERPLHPGEKVIETVLRWSIWDAEERKANCLILRENTLYPSLVHFAKEPKSISGELKYADSKSKSFRKFTFHLTQDGLKYFKDSKSTSELGSWKMDDIVWYIGCESKRNAPTKWTFTFVKRNYVFKRSKEEPFFGNVVVCTSEDELHKWIAALIIGEHPEGLNPIFV